MGYTKRQIVNYWEKSEGRCWRCGKKILGKPIPIYGKDWEIGHVGKARWAGGIERAPEHIDCNREDGKEQTRLAAKAVRRMADQIGIKKRSGFQNARGGKWKTKLTASGPRTVPRDGE